MKRCLLIFALCTLMLNLCAQNYYNNWYFGDFAGLSFNSDPPIALLNSKMSTREGCSSISDSAGNLLFYTDGSTVWNKYHDTMKNGAGLFGNSSSSQASLIVKQPNNKNIYYIFTTDAFNGISNYFDLNSLNKGVNYSIIDLSLDNGMGEVVSKNVELVKNSCEKIAAVQHHNKTDIWISTVKRFSDSIFVFKLTSSGISNPLIFKNPLNKSALGQNKQGTGIMKFSPNGKLLAYVDGDYDSSFIHLFDFNSKDGTLSNYRRIFNAGPYGPYGIEFSTNEKFMYVTNGFGRLRGNLYQVSIESIGQNIDLFSVAAKINSGSTDRISGGIQLAPDGKIYLAMHDSFLSVIQSPDSTLLKCRFLLNGIILNGKKSLIGLPNCVQSQIYYPIKIVSDTSCFLDSVKFIIKNAKLNSVSWDFGDGTTLTNYNNSIQHLYQDSGTYVVSAKINLSNGQDTIIFSKTRVEFIPISILGNDTILCVGDSLKLNINNPLVNQYLWENGNNSTLRILKNSGVYSVKISNSFCHAYDTFLLSFGKKPLVFIGNDTAFCHRFKHLLNAGKDFKSYLWSTSEQTYSITVDKAGIYNVKVKDSLLCEAADTIDLKELHKPIISSVLDTISCEFINLSIARQSATSYLWNTGDTGLSIKINKKGSYHVTLSNPFCSVADTFSVNFLPRPIIDLGPDTNLCNWITLSTRESGNYLWNDGQKTPSITVLRPGTYTLKVSRNQCESIDTIVLKPCDEIAYFVPDAFSPNGDAHNNTFKVYGKNIESVHLMIYNSWGQKIFDATDADPNWDGSYMNEICPQGVYSYLIVIYGYNLKKYYLSGTLNLLR